ncbi:MAG TPA: tripartite tricarboxylate transporter substrate-binding protein [Vicinamibacteria bacterium]|jgi:putative tricarboxylic transport membrane protein
MRVFLWPVILLSGCALPSRGFECLAPANPGGGWDLTCRAVAQVANELQVLPQTLRVLNLPGAGGGIAFAHAVAERRGDESVIVAASPSTTLRIAEKQFGDFTENDVRWVGAIAADFGVITVAHDAPWRDLSDLIQAWKETPGEVVVAGGSAVGGQDHMRVLLLADAAGIGLREIRYVPFDGGGEAITALLGGFVEVVPVDASEIAEHVRAGTVRILAVLGPERLGPPFASAATAREQGYDVSSVVWRGFYAPQGISDEGYRRWVEALQRVERSEAWTRVRNRFGLTPYHSVGPEFEEVVRQEVERFRELTERLGLAS